jgi:signal transduction histidine kinase/serine phosphatase RsbU (regulator of sigma subunit)/anti-sigma regulatory factor (Ser/Thr protein kinase)
MARFSSQRGGFLAGGGECGALARSLDWGTTPLGPAETWPASLQSAAAICLESRFGLCVFWGPGLIAIYNDTYAPMLGSKHPRAMGMPLREIWPEIWGEIGPMLDVVVRKAQATWSEDQMLMLERNGFAEEAYFTFSFSPIRDETGGVAGVFTAVQETTKHVVTTRRLQALARVGERVAEAESRDEVARAAIAALGEATEDVPFAMLHLLDDDGHARPAGAAGVTDEAAARWAEVAAGAAAGGRDVPVDEPGIDAKRAVVLPVRRPGSARPAAALTLGVSPRRPLDEAYHTFQWLLAGQVGAALANAEGTQAERERADALAELDLAKTEFFSNVSHEFRTPLMLMLGPLADALAEPDADAGEQRARIELSHRGALRLLRLVNALLDFSRMEAGRAAASFVPVDLALMIEETAAVFRAATERSGLELRVDVPDGEPTIEADPDMLEKILLNLLSNAYKFTFEGAIDIRLRMGERAVIEIADTGVGVPVDEQPRLFERFHRVEGTSGRSHEGSGIGLALVGELVALHGGEVGVSSVAGEGSTFRVELPLRQPGAGEARGGDASLREAQRAGYGLEALRWDDREPIAVNPPDEAAAELLVVDDNADMREYLARRLGDRYAVRTAIDGEDALAQLRERPADLIVTDVMMARMDGFALLERLRQDPRTRRLPVIVLSARAGEEAIVEGLGAGADDYLVKPFSTAELLARVHANLEVVRLRDALAAGERERAREIEGVALTLQRSLLPRELPDVLGARLASRYVPAGASLEIGGDFYDATGLGNGRVAIAIGDVAGHGVLAAAVMGQVRQALRAYVLEGHAPSALMSRLDRLVHESGLVMTTCLCGIFDPASGRLAFANAGHPPPLIRRADGRVERLEGGLSHPLGASAGIQHVQAEAELAVGDTLLLYTDGVVERRGETIDLGIDRLAQRLATAPPAPDAVCESIAGALDPALRDDAALLALARSPMADEQMRVVLPAYPARLGDLRRRLGAWLDAQVATRMEREDVVLAVHEAAMNAVEHAYGPGDAQIEVVASRRGDGVEIEVRDRGHWRDPRDVQRGRGQGIMSAVMDEVTIDTGPRGSTVRLRRRLEGAP